MRFIPVLALLALATPALAQETPVVPTAAAGKAKKGEDDPDKVICRNVGSTGSLLFSRSECHTRAEWRQLSEDTRDAMRSRGSTVPAPPVRPGGGG